MIFIKKNSDTESSVIFKKVKCSLKEQVLNVIINAFPESLGYIIEICGIDIDSFIESMKSNTYILEKNETKKFIKNLPKVYVFSNCCEDTRLFGRSIGNFNEGYMALYILKTDKVEMCDKQQVLNSIQENKLCTVEVESDGEAFNILCDSPERMQLICHSIEKEKTEDGALS